ncbi:hypothetical protein F5Y14DRAFT_267262 [Nemania sp. NC0429]|nr:hypothetical protein F5Y14DRAFT_267262 [Nemania sp. NC0429]
MASLYDLAVPVLTNILKAEQHLLAQAEAFAADKGTPISEILELRLAPDMWPLSQQIVISALHTGSFLAKAAGITPNTVVFGPASLEDSKKYLVETLELLASVKPEDLNGKEDKILKAQLGANYEPEMTAYNYVQGYMLPNVYFHLTTLYDLLRNKNVPLGKKDYISHFVRLA